MGGSALFNTVADDSLKFGLGPQFNPKGVVDWLGLTNDEVSKIAAVAKSSVRFDKQIPRQVVERFEEIANIVNMVAVVFNGDAQKTALWFRTKNPFLGDVSPRDMVRLGRYDRLRRYVISAMNDQAMSKRG